MAASKRSSCSRADPLIALRRTFSSSCSRGRRLLSKSSRLANWTPPLLGCVRSDIHANEATEERRDIGTLNDKIHHAVLQQELRCRGVLRKLLTHRLLDHAATGKADICARFGDVDIAQHGEARRNAAEAWVNHDREIWQSH